MLRRAVCHLACGVTRAESTLCSTSAINQLRDFRCFASAATEKAKIIDGKGIALKWQKSLATEAARLTEELGRQPGLAVIVAGERPDSTVYVQRKQDACEEVGIRSTLYTLPENAVEADVQTVIEQLSNDTNVDGILVQLPLPPGLREAAILETLSPSKDVDGLSPLNVGRMLMRGHLPAYAPCPALACIELLKRSKIPIRNKKVVVLGDSNTVGLPLAVQFRDEGAAAVTICHRVAMEAHNEESKKHAAAVERAAAEACLPKVPGYPEEQTAADRLQQMQAQKPQNRFLPEVCKTADILVVAVGQAELVTSEWVKPGAVVLDVGINVKQPAKKGKKHNLVGDVAYDDVSQVASAISPVPGGVGPMTIAALLSNTLEAARQHAEMWKR